MQFGLFDSLEEEALAILTQRSTTGFSKDRTPAKHGLYGKQYGREIAVAHKNPAIANLVWLDQSAGDGIAKNGGTWHRNCSPGILAYHARYPGVIGGRSTGRLQVAKPVDIDLYEINDHTYRLLLKNLARELPALHYERLAEGYWKCGPVNLRAHNCSGAEADLSRITPRTAVRISNDPNSIADWVMPPEMPSQIRKLTPWFLGICTMGCNVGGLHRRLVEHPEEADRWYESVRSVQKNLQTWHDLYLCAIDRDASQWAYLIIAPSKATPQGTNWKQVTQDDAEKCFSKQGMSLRGAWLGDQQQKFDEILDYLFTLKKGKLKG